MVRLEMFPACDAHNILLTVTHNLTLNMVVTSLTYKALMQLISGFGGLVVSMLASGTQDRVFAPGRSRRIFWSKNSSAYLPEVKPFASCRRFAACQRTL
jgi:hypothetical protein